MKITKFIFTHKSDGTILSYNTPDEAIIDFTNRGYGMHNWNIQVQFDDYYASISSISLLVFNYITDNWV